MSELRGILIRVEQATSKKLGADTGVWIEKFVTANPSGGPSDVNVGMNGGLPPGYGPPGYEDSRRYGPSGYIPPATGEATGTTNGPGTIAITCRAVNLVNVSPSANTDVAFALENELKASALFDPKETKLFPKIDADDASGTFTFGVTVVLKNPLKF